MTPDRPDYDEEVARTLAAWDEQPDVTARPGLSARVMHRLEALEPAPRRSMWRGLLMPAVLAASAVIGVLIAWQGSTDSRATELSAVASAYGWSSSDAGSYVYEMESQK